MPPSQSPELSGNTNCLNKSFKYYIVKNIFAKCLEYADHSKLRTWLTILIQHQSISHAIQNNINIESKDTYNILTQTQCKFHRVHISNREMELLTWPES